MRGDGVYLVKMPNGRPFRTAYNLQALAERKARQVGGEAIAVEWDESPPAPPEDPGQIVEGGLTGEDGEE
jgi:hypothetical protein